MSFKMAMSSSYQIDRPSALEAEWHVRMSTRFVAALVGHVDRADMSDELFAVPGETAPSIDFA